MPKITKEQPQEEVVRDEVQETAKTVKTEWITNAGQCVVGQKVELDKETYDRLKAKGFVK